MVDAPGGRTFYDFGVTIGDTFQGFLSYDETATDIRPLPNSSWYIPATGLEQNNFTLTVRGATFIAPNHSLNVGNGTMDRLDIWGGIFPFEDETVIQTPWGDRPSPEFGHDLFSGYFHDDTGTALSSTALPVNLDLSQWTSNSFFLEMDLGRDGGAQLSARITSIERVPETGETAVLLGVSFLTLVAATRVNRKPRSP
jgi:hypothetical protein